MCNLETENFIHPMRYPKHKDSNKGQVLGGECNTSKYSNTDSYFWNVNTYGIYCYVCAREQNKWSVIDCGYKINIEINKKPETIQQCSTIQSNAHELKIK